MATKINKVMVTGSGGFIGKHLCHALIKNGYEIIEFDIKNNELDSILETRSLHGCIKNQKPDVIIHLAAVSNRRDTDKDPILALTTNIIGTFNVLTFAKKYGVKVILASSAATKQPELSIYGSSKDCMEKIAALFDNVTIARFYNVYGPGSKSVVNKFIKRIKVGDPVRLNGNTIRDYVYIDNIVDALIKLMYWKKGTYELGTGTGTSLKQLVKLIGKLTGKDFVATLLKPIKEIQNSQMEKNWYVANPISLTEGIKKLI